MSNHSMCGFITLLTYSQWVYICTLYGARCHRTALHWSKSATKAHLEMCFRLMPDLVCCVQIYSGTMRRTIAPPGARRRWSSVRRRVEGGGGRPMRRRRRRRVEEHIYSFLACLLPLSLLIPLLDSFGSAPIFSVSSRLYFLALNCTSMPLTHTHLLASLRKTVKSLFICIILCQEYFFSLSAAILLGFFGRITSVILCWYNTQTS